MMSMDEDKYAEQFHNTPIFQRAYEIVKITKALVESIDDAKDKLNLKSQMLSNALMIPEKVASAEVVDLYSIKMENAVIIKIAARDLIAQSSLCKQMQLNHPEHLKLLRDEIENFRLVYREWISGFDPSDDIDDGWYNFK
jgi:hypothetical protein